MSFFARLLILFTLFISSNSFADAYIKSSPSTIYPTFADACRALVNSYGFNFKEVISAGRCAYTRPDGSEGSTSSGDIHNICHERGQLSTVLFDYNTEVPIIGCEPVYNYQNGGYCVWQLQGNPDRPMILNLPNTNVGKSKHSVIHVSKGYSKSCNIQKKGICNPKDPYGGCYTPPDDGCTRHKDGSITCPEQKQPEIKQGCENGATYCNQPKDGCGSGYVSGTFNGKNICVIANNSTSNNSSSDSSSSSDNSNSANSGTNSGSNSNGSNNSDNSNSANNSNTNNGANSSGGSTGGSSSGGGTDNNNQDGEKNNENSDKDGCENLSNCDWVKGSKFDEFVDYFKGLFDSEQIEKEAKKELDGIGEKSKDENILGAENKATSSINQLSNMLTFSNMSCISDFQIDVFGSSINIPVSEYCDLMALIKIILQISVLLFCARVIVLETNKL